MYECKKCNTLVAESIYGTGSRIEHTCLERYRRSAGWNTLFLILMGLGGLLPFYYFRFDTLWLRLLVAGTGIVIGLLFGLLTFRIACKNLERWRVRKDIAGGIVNVQVYARGGALKWPAACAWCGRTYAETSGQIGSWKVPSCDTCAIRVRRARRLDLMNYVAIPFAIICFFGVWAYLEFGHVLQAILVCIVGLFPLLAVQFLGSRIMKGVRVGYLFEGGDEHVFSFSAKAYAMAFCAANPADRRP